MPKWSDWTDDPQTWDAEKQNPYVNWWMAVGADQFDPDPTPPEFFDFRSFMRQFLSRPTYTAGKDSAYEGLPPGFDLGQFPVPPALRNPEFEPGKAGDWWPKPEALRATSPAREEVIVGIVDEAIALSHRAFLDTDGNSRILAAWQQNAAWSGPPVSHAKTELDAAKLGKGKTHDQAYLPFGRELYQHDIDALRARCTSGGWLDQPRFDMLAGLSDFSSIHGLRSLSSRAAHGTHVAALAAGDSAHKIIAVNLPNRQLIGLSGTFLEFFFLMGVLRIIGLADMLFERAFGSVEDNAKAGQIFGYPMVINLSFSKQAGVRDANLSIWQVLAGINKSRLAEGKSKVHFVFPAGNDNLLEGVGNVILPAKTKGKPTSETIKLLVHPEDQSSSFVEIWTAARANGVAAPEMPLRISIRGPAGYADSGTLSAGTDGSFRDLHGATQSPIARLYSNAFTTLGGQRGLKADAVTIRQRYILALRPTLIQRADQEAVLPGVWTIALENHGDEPLSVSIEVQSDQSALPSAATGLRPRLLDDSYHRYDGQGRALDSFAYGPGPVTPTPEGEVIKRQGTINAVASAARFAVRTRRRATPQLGRSIIIAAGHRVSDGRPAEYSSTGIDRKQDPLLPTLSFPCEDTPAAAGILSAGATDGSAVALSGTSFAAAQATRLSADLLAAHWDKGFGFDLVGALETQASGHKAPAHYHAVAPAKSGAGRLPNPKPGGPQR